MSLSDKLRRRYAADFSAALNHPYALGLGDGSLSRERFIRWLRQDWLYLLDYVEALEAAARLCDDSEARAMWAELAKFTRRAELDHHQALSAEFGLSLEQLNSTRPYPSTTDYIGVLRAASASYPSLVATLTPCAVSYAELAVALAARGESPVPEYQNWIETYTEQGFLDSIPNFTRELDRAAQSSADAAAAEAAYSRAIKCEVAFWDGLWRGQ